MSVQKPPLRYRTAHTAGGMCVPQIAAVIFVVVVVVHGLFFLFTRMLLKIGF